MTGPRIAASATVEDGASIGEGTSVWDGVTIRGDARVGVDCVLGRGCFIDVGVVVGDRCKVQNNALLYQPARLGRGVFVGPAAVLTNDRFPRAVNPDGSSKSTEDWKPAGVRVGDGASIGANATVIGGVSIGEWAMIAANATVTRDVPAHALVAGSPARRIAWVGAAGRPLQVDGDDLVCPETGARFRSLNGGLREMR